MMTFIKQYSENQQIDEIFRTDKEEIKSITKATFEKSSSIIEREPEFQTTQHPKYIKCFLAIYFGYLLNKILANTLVLVAERNQADSGSLSNKSIGYIVVVEKELLSNIIGDKENLGDIISTSGIVQRGNEQSKSLRIFTEGEGLLPVLQNEFHLDLPLKAY